VVVILHSFGFYLHINAVYTNFKETKLEEDIKSLAKEKLKLERENQILSK
jgi:hypothetical protein